ncbi:MAG: hypothetical protein RI932_144 [Pseudomonadota bacterium]|jgi:hypothetical protein
MTTVSTKVYQLERRTFLKLSAAAVMAGGVLDLDAAYAQGVCKVISDPMSPAEKPLSAASTPADYKLLFWIDGPMNEGLPGYSGNLMTRARLSVTMKSAQTRGSGMTPAEYIESVSLVRVVSPTQKVLMAQSFFSAETATESGRAPYAVFENLDLSSSGKYEVIISQFSNNMMNVYKHTLENPRPSRFDYKHVIGGGMPLDFAQSFITDLAGDIKESNQYFFTGQGPDNNGYINTPFGVSIGGPHTCRARILEIKTDGDFRIEVDFMHGDADSAHYMRYFLVLDPVGRVLGGVRRIFGDGVTGKVEVRRGFFTPVHPTASAGVPATPGKDYRDANNKEYRRLHGQRITSRMDPALISIQALSPAQEANYIGSLSILDCPHINIYTDDRFHAVARASIKLR